MWRWQSLTALVAVSEITPKLPSLENRGRSQTLTIGKYSIPLPAANKAVWFQSMNYLSETLMTQRSRQYGDPSKTSEKHPDLVQQSAQVQEQTTTESRTGRTTPIFYTKWSVTFHNLGSANSSQILFGPFTKDQHFLSYVLKLHSLGDFLFLTLRKPGDNKPEFPQVCLPQSPLLPNTHSLPHLTLPPGLLVQLVWARACPFLSNALHSLGLTSGF